LRRATRPSAAEEDAAVLADLRTALRSLLRTPGFVLVAVLALALGLALSTTMFAVMDAIVNPFSPYKDADRLFRLSFWYGPHAALTRADLYRVIRDQAQSFSAIVPRVFGGATLRSEDEETEVGTEAVPPRWFAVTGIAPEMGRAFAPADGDGVAVVSRWLWTRLYGRRTSLEGTTVTLGDRVYAIVGVMSREASPVGGVAAWLPLPADAEATLQLPTPLVRLRPGVTADRARAELKVLSDALTASRHASDYPYALLLDPVRERRGELTDIHKAMVGAALAVLLIACVNLAHLMLARGLAKRRELAMRMALGATRAAVVRLMLAECALITLAGGALGILVAVWGRDVLETAMPREVAWIGIFQPQLSWRVFALSGGAAVLSAVLFGLLPALRVASSVELTEPLKDAGTVTARTRQRYSPLVVSEVALALVLLMGGGLLLRTVQQLKRETAGLNVERLVSAFVVGRLAGERSRADVDWDQAVAAVQRVPGVAQAAYERNRRLDGMAIAPELTEDTSRLLVARSVPLVSAGYLRALGLPILRGRDFEPGDAAGNGAAILNSIAAERLYPHQDPVGRMIKLGAPRKDAPWVPIVGVARSEIESRFGVEIIRQPQVWVARRDSVAARGYGRLVIRTLRRDPRVSTLIRRQLRSVPSVGSASVMPYAYYRDVEIASRGFLADVFVGMGLIALALAALGLYGVLSYAVTQRMREYGVRLALGAEPRALFRMVLHDGAVMLLAGVGVGAFAARAAGRLLDAVLVAVLPSDVVSLVAAEAVLLGAGLLAAVGPARRASRSNPVDVLRAV
jgi:putative ABC transport system permease protein